MADKAIATVDARLGDLDEIVEVDEANEVDEADEVNEVDEVNKAIVIATDEADEAIEANKATETKILDEVNKMPMLLPFSLTKYPAIFAEVKGSFGVNNNQLLEFEAVVDDVCGSPYAGNEIDNQLGTI